MEVEVSHKAGPPALQLTEHFYIKPTFFFFPFFQPIYLVTYGQTIHLILSLSLNMFLHLCCCSYCTLHHSLSSSWCFFTHPLSKKGVELLSSTIFFYLFLLDLFFHGVEWFLWPQHFFPALLKRRMTSLWQAVCSDQTLWSTDAEAALLSAR